MQKIKIIIKLFAFIFIIKATFLLSFAFVGDSLGLDIYKNIDKGIVDLNSTMYSYELKGAKSDGKIYKKINSKLKINGLSKCSVSENISEEDIKEIAYGNGNIGLLSEKIKGKCDNTSDLNKTQQIIKKIFITSKKYSNEKSKEIYNISKIGLFSDGSIKNSPFDIVKDIKDIDYVIFTQVLEYEGEESIGDNKIGEYLDGKLEKIKKNIDSIPLKINDFENDINSDIAEDLKPLNDKVDNILGNVPDKEIVSIEYNEEKLNKAEYSCPVDDSGLSQEDIKNILEENYYNQENENNSIYNINNGKGNGENNGLGDNPFSFSTSGSNQIGANYDYGINKKDYEPTNDNDFFPCDKFICVEVDLITHQSNLLIGGKTRSIQSIMERSNKHLKKFAESSLVQSKMTTNNFELGLIDINLSDIFSMPFIITKRSPPILNLDFFPKKKTSDPLAGKNLIKSRFKAEGIKFDRENDLSIFYDKDAELKNVSRNAELNLSKAFINDLDRKNQLKEIAELDNHISRIIDSNNQNEDTEGLYKEFIELERFAANLSEYTDNLDKINDKMLSIPINP